MRQPLNELLASIRHGGFTHRMHHEGQRHRPDGGTCPAVLIGTAMCRLQNSIDRRLLMRFTTSAAAAATILLVTSKAWELKVGHDHPH